MLAPNRLAFQTFLLFELLHVLVLEAVPLDSLVFFSQDTVPSGWEQESGSRRLIIGSGLGPALTNRTFGDLVGRSYLRLNASHLPPHSHPFTTLLWKGTVATVLDPGSSVCFGDEDVALFANETPDANVAFTSKPNGNGEDVDLGQPTCSHPLYRCTATACPVPLGGLVWTAHTAVPPGYSRLSDDITLAIEPGTNQQALCWGRESHRLSGEELPAHSHTTTMPSFVDAATLAAAGPNSSIAVSSTTVPPDPPYSQSCLQPGLYQPSLQAAGNGQAFSLQQPSLALGLLECSQPSGCDDFLGMVVPSRAAAPSPAWAATNGQLLSAASNAALFALLGTTFGGNGITTFALPDLQGRTPRNTGSHILGEEFGFETQMLTLDAMTRHQHSLFMFCNDPGTTSAPARYFNVNYSHPNQASCSGRPLTTGVVGDGLPFSIMQPSLVLNYYILFDTSQLETTGAPAASASTYTNHDVSAPGTYNVVVFSSSLTVHLSPNIGIDQAWIVATSVTLGGELILDISELNLADLDGYTVQLLDAGQVDGQFSVVTVIGSSSHCPVTASVSASWAVTFQIEPSCTYSLAASAHPF